MALALARWESEGGALGRAGAALAASERHVLECLGAAVVIAWNDLPTDVQRAMFKQAAAVNESLDPALLKARIARFLHDHKDDPGAPRSGSQ